MTAGDTAVLGHLRILIRDRSAVAANRLNLSQMRRQERCARFVEWLVLVAGPPEDRVARAADATEARPEVGG